MGIDWICVNCCECKIANSWREWKTEWMRRKNTWYVEIKKRQSVQTSEMNAGKRRGGEGTNGHWFGSLTEERGWGGGSLGSICFVQDCSYYPEGLGAEWACSVPGLCSLLQSQIHAMFWREDRNYKISTLHWFSNSTDLFSVFFSVPHYMKHVYRWQVSMK